MPLSFEIVEHCGDLSDERWKKELNIVKWGDNIAKYDIRSWSPDHSNSGKGITLSLSEIRALKEILNSIDI